MSVTLAQNRQRVLNHLREDSTNTHFPDTTVIDGYLNEAQEDLAVFIEYPRVFDSVVTQLNIGSYANPADNLLIRTVYFGDKNVAGDWKPVKFVTEETLREFYPSWGDNTVSTQADRPEYIIQIDRKTLHIFPRPNSVAAGKKLWINYNYVPAPMVNDSDVPDLPLPYHNLLSIYALHLCYIDLQNMKVSDELLAQYQKKAQRLQSAVTKESKENLSFSWGTEDFDVMENTGGIRL